MVAIKLSLKANGMSVMLIGMLQQILIGSFQLEMVQPVESQYLSSPF